MPLVSVVCPFFNEEAIIERAIEGMARNLETLGRPWELILVNDGSVDESPELAARTAARFPGVRVVGYPVNRGRGHALRHGMRESKGDLIVTTEVDLSWGEKIVHELVAALEANPKVDIVVASPHKEGGGYKNVPPLRVFLSTAGNWVIRTGLSYAVTMNTGMTRGYRRERILALPLDEDGKELHLEIISKALALGYRISEIPAILEWKDHKLANPDKAKRKSSSKIKPIIGSHLLFSIIAAPFRYLYVLAMIGVMAGLGFVGAAFYQLFVGKVAIYFALTGFSLMLIALLLAALALLSQQGRILQAESWRVRSELRQKELGKTG